MPSFSSKKNYKFSFLSKLLNYSLNMGQDRKKKVKELYSRLRIAICLGFSFRFAHLNYPNLNCLQYDSRAEDTSDTYSTMHVSNSPT